MVVFKGGKREVAKLKQEFQHCAIVATSANGWMDPELTKVWVDSVVGAFAFNRRLLTWDSYECHIGDSITESLKSKKIDPVIVPGGCTKRTSAGISRSRPLARENTMNGWEQSEFMKKLLLVILNLPREELFCSGFWMHGLSYQQMLSRILSEAVP